MKMKRILAMVLSAVMLISSGTAIAAQKKTDKEQPRYSGEYEAFRQIADYIAERYIDDSYTNDEIMTQGISKLLENNDPLLVELLKATLESMDDYSEFYTPEEYKEFENQVTHTFYGIGVSMKTDSDGYVVIKGFAEESGNAEKAGFQVGDKFFKVNGEDVTGLTLNEVREKIVGEEGTKVKITVLRGGEEIELTATRVAVSSNTVSGGILNGNIGYIQITSFAPDTDDEFAGQLEVMRENNVKDIIIDVRNNGGGVVSSATNIAETIVPKGKIIDVKYRQAKYDMTYSSNLAKKEFDFIVLVNEHTASASEILASAIQDSGAGKLVGTTTFGKAVIQNTFPLSNGSVFKLTTGQYITRNGREINHIGLTPDEYAENETGKIDMSDYSKFDFKTRETVGNRSENVRAAKERLSVLGYYEGDKDSDIFDAELKKAVSSFQRSNDIFSYGILDAVTQVCMENKMLQIETVRDNQFIKAYEMFGGKEEDLFAE